MDEAALRAVAEAWMAADPEHEREVAAMLDDPGQLREHFGATLDFGTGGMRGHMGPGTNRMNRLMVRRVTAALAEVLAEGGDDARVRGVALAYDARHNSRLFAEDVARVLASRGFRVHLADTVVPTPVLSFATTELGAAAGIIITASHNPPADNGYKVFQEDGSQIVPPVDTAVSAILEGLPLQIEAPSLEAVANRIVPWPGEVLDRYFARIAAVRVHPATGARVVYTPVHGVGAAFVRRALTSAGHTELHVVPEQAEPDGAFPTVTFPNPEEPGVLDLSFALADEVGADVILANDPDADRLAVAVQHEGAWRQLSGNQVGVLFAEELLSRQQVRDTDLIVTTIVSTAMARSVAEAHGVRYAEALTGFKWIAARAREHDPVGRFLYGFEESLGYSIGDVVRDKDGVSAALLMADLVSDLKARGLTLIDMLERLYRQHGLYLGHQRSVRLPGASGAARIAEAMAALRADPPTSFDDRAVVTVRDIQSGIARRADGTTYELDLPSSNVLAFDLEDGSRVLARPSGTEPKIKFYFEVVEAMGDQTLAEAEARARAALARMDAELLARLGLQ